MEAHVKPEEIEIERHRLAAALHAAGVSGVSLLWSPPVVATVQVLEACEQDEPDVETRTLLGHYWLMRWSATRQRSALRKTASLLSGTEILTNVITSDSVAAAVGAAAAQAQAELKAEADRVEIGTEGADSDAVIALSAFVLSHMRLADTAFVTAAQRNLAYAYSLAGRHQGSLDHLVQALTLSLEAVSAEPDDTDLSRQLTADIASGVTVLGDATPVRLLQDLREQFVPRARRYAARGYRPQALHAALGCVALSVWHADGDPRSVDEARTSLDQAALSAEVGTEMYVGARANLGAVALLQARASGRLDDYHQAIAILSEAEAEAQADPGHRFYPNIQLALASAFQQRYWGFGNPGDQSAAQRAAQRAFEAIRRHPIRGLWDLRLYAKYACGFADVADDPSAIAELLTLVGKLRQDWAQALSAAPEVAARVDEARGLLALRLASHCGADEQLLQTAVDDLTRAISATELVSELRSRLGKLGQALELIGMHHPSRQTWTDLVTVAEALIGLSTHGSAEFERGVAAHNLALARARQASAEAGSGGDAEAYSATIDAIVELELAAVANAELPARQRLRNAVAAADLIDHHWPDRSALLWEAASALLAEVAAWYLPLPAREEILERFEHVATCAADRLLRSCVEDAADRALTVLRRDSHLLATGHRRLRQLEAALDRHPALAERYRGLVTALLAEETWQERSPWEDRRRFDVHRELESLVEDLLAESPVEAAAEPVQDFPADRIPAVHLFAAPEQSWALITGPSTAAVALSATSHELEMIAAEIPGLAKEELTQLRAAAQNTTSGQVPPPPEEGTELLQTLRRLGEAVAQPVLDTLATAAASEPVRRLHWVLHGRLAGLPMHVAVLDDATPHRSSRPEYLLDRCEVTYGLTDALAGSGTDTAPQEGPPVLLAVGAPDDGRTALPQAGPELAIAKESGPWAKTTTLIGAGATVEQTIDQLQHADAVHFALHGTANPQHPSLSALHLTGGALTVERLLGLDLGHVQLGNLSACQTAVVAADRLRSESLSLATGFHLAGLARVVATLWSVPDRTTRDFNAEFYNRTWVDGEFRPGQAAAALRGAMIAVRERTGCFAWPSAWAGFALVCDRPDRG